MFDSFSSPEPVVSWSRGRETRGSATGRLQIKPRGSGDENMFDCVCLNEMQTFASRKALLLLCGFCFSSLEKITLDSEQPMLKEKWIIPLV